MSARAACALPLVMVAAGCQAMIESITPVLMDYHKELKGVADALADVSPRESWERPVDGFDVTSITTLGAGLAVFQTRDLVGSFAAQRSSNGELICVETATGAERWRRDLEDDPEFEFAVFATAVGRGLMLVETTAEATRLQAIDPLSGDDLWGADLAAGAAVAFTSDSTRVVTAAHGEATELSCRDARGGELLWSRTVKVAHTPDLEVREDAVVLLASDVHCFALASGEPRWRGGLAADEEATAVAPLEDGYLLFTKDGLLRLLDRAGTVAWTVQHACAPFAAEARDERVFVLAVGADGLGRILCLDAASGVARWTRTVPRFAESLPRPFSLITVHEGRVYYTLAETLEVVCAESGDGIASLPLPGSPSADRLPDRLRTRPGALVVASEEFVAAVDCAGPEWGWCHEVRDADSFTNHTLQVAAGLAAERAARPPEPMAPASTGSGWGTTINYSTGDSSYLNWARGNYRSTMSDSSATSQDRINASRTYEGAMRNQRAAEQTALNFGMLSAAQSAIMSAPEMARAMAAQMRREISRFKGEVTMLRADLQSSSHLLSLQGDWYCRPFLTSDAQGLFVVDTRSGEWAEVVLLLNEGDLREWYAGVPLPLIDVDRGLLLAHGVTLDTSKWRLDDRFTVFTCAGRSLLGFELDAIKLLGPELYPEYSLSSLGAE